MNSPRLPLHLVSGFLGAGKTTLINAVLREPAFAGTMVVVNEFGEVGVDQALIAQADDGVVLLESGCLCCAAGGNGLRDTLIDLFARRASGELPAFQRLIVETSGLAHPGPLVAALLGDSALTPRCGLVQVLTLVDALHGEATLDRHAEAQRQVAFADRLLLTKTDLAPQAAGALAGRLAGLNAEAGIGRWHPGAPALPCFDAPVRRGLPRSPPAGAWARGAWRAQYGADYGGEGMHGPAFAQVRSQVIVLPGPLPWPDYAALTERLRAFAARLLRCKGLLALGDDPARPWAVQGVQGWFAPPERLPAWPPALPRGFLVCITEGLPREALQAAIAPAMAQEESSP